MASHQRLLHGVIFDYGNTLIRVDPALASKRADYADVVALPGAERLERFLVAEGLLAPGAAGTAFVERFLEIRERNRVDADASGVEITAVESLAEALRGSRATDISDELLRRAVAEYFIPEAAAIEEIPGAGETLRLVRDRGARVALLSNATDGAYVKGVARRLGWESAFDPFVVSADIGVRKPRAEAFRAVLDLWPLDPAEIAMVGDSLYHDVAGAKRLGLFTVHLTAIVLATDAAHPAVRGDLTVSSHLELRKALLPLLA